MTRKIADPSPAYLTAGDIDAVMRLNTSLLSEIWLLRDRLAILEQLLAEKSILGPGEIDMFSPDIAMEARLESLRAQMIDRAMNSAGKAGYTVQSLIDSPSAR